MKLDLQVKVEPSDVVRTGMYSPVRDRYPDGTELTIAELLRYSICESDGSTSDVLIKLGASGSGQYPHGRPLDKIRCRTFRLLTLRRQSAATCCDLQDEVIRKNAEGRTGSRDRPKAFALRIVRMFSSLPKTPDAGAWEADAPFWNFNRR